jgi:hypothetical protein
MEEYMWVVFLVTVIIAGTSSSPPATAQLDPTAASVYFDCNAFRKNPNGTWTTTQATSVSGGFDADAGKRDFAAGTTFGPNMFRPMNADIVELLDRRCKPTT